MGWFSGNKDTEQDPYLQKRLDMVRIQIAGRDVTDESVLDTMRRVPRHEFVSPRYRNSAYDDSPLPIENDQTISQPYIVGSMTERLKPSKSKIVLEIGTGSGYQTAVLAELFEKVYTVEYFKDLAIQAKRTLERLGYANIVFHIGDGLIVPSDPPDFDAIIVTAAPELFPDSLLRRLRPGGQLVIPVGSYAQTLQVASKDEEGQVSIRSLYGVRFVSLRSDSQ
ncbi:MAG: protein-L-isoaspartate(D-aspartate) O-methyltransferase [Candidatus Zixiibacteriota bacterium]